MKIQPISVFNYTKTPVNNVHRTPKFTPIQDSVNFGSIFNHSEKKTLQKRAKAYKKQAEIYKAGIDFTLDRAQNTLVRNAFEAQEYLKKSKQNHMEVADLIMRGLKNGLEPFTYEQNGKSGVASFEYERVRNKKLPRAMYEFDEDNNLIRKTEIENLNIKSIRLFDKQTGEVDLIKTNGANPVEYFKNYKENNSEAIYEFEHGEIKKVSKNVVKVADMTLTDEICEYDYPGTISSYKRNVVQREDNSSEYDLKVGYQKYGNMVADYIEQNVKIEEDEKTAERRIELVHGKDPLNIKIGYKNIYNQFASAKEKYSFSGGELVMLDVIWSRNSGVYRANEVFRFDNYGELDEYKADCRMNTRLTNEYNCKKKIVF